MGDLSATINTKLLDNLTAGQGLFLKDFIVTPIWDRRSYHPPGTTGSLICKMGKLATKLVVVGKIVAASTAAYYTEYESMITAWADDQAPFTILGPDSTSYVRCYLQSESLYLSQPVMACGSRDGQVFGEFRAAFLDYL